MTESWDLVIRCALELASPSECDELHHRMAEDDGPAAGPESVRLVLAHASDAIPADRKAAMLAVLQRVWAGATDVAPDLSDEVPELTVAGRDASELLSALARGEPGAFDDLFAAYSDRLLRYVRRYLPAREEAEDVVQDLFLALWDRRAEFERVRDLEGYLYTAARNRAMTNLKRRRTEARWRDRASGADSSELLEGPDPTELVASAETAAALQRAIDGLPARQREVMLRYWRGERNVEIAAALGISPMTIGVHVNRAMKHLREVLLRVLG